MLDFTLFSADAVIHAIALSVYACVFVLIGSYYWESLRVAQIGFSRSRLSPHLFLAIAAMTAVFAAAFSILWGFENALFALLFSAGMVLSLLDPVVAVGFFVANVVLRPWELDGTPTTAVIPKIVAGICVFSWFFHGIRRRTWGVLWNAPCAFFLGLVLWILFSAAMSGEADEAFRSYSDTVLIAAVLFFLVVNIANHPRDIRLFRDLVVISVFGVIAVAWISTAADPSVERLTGRGMIGNSNDLAAAIVLVLPWLLIPKVTAYLEKRGGSKNGLFLKGLIALATAVFLVGLWMSQSRGAMLAFLLSGFSFFVSRSRRPGRALLYGLVFIPIFVIAVSVFNLTRKSEDVEGSTQSRWSFAVAGLRMAAQHPVLGVGFNRYPKVFESFASGGTYEWGQRTAHSTWVLALAENGVPGLFFLVGLFLTTLRRAWRLRPKWPEFFPAMVGYGVAMSFLSHTYLFYPYLLFAIVIAAAKIQAHEVAV